jgi:hypothetical protein
MKSTHTGLLIAAALVCAVALTVFGQDTKKEKQQQDVRDSAHKTLQELYKAEPNAKAAVKHSAGYAVFNNLGVKILVAGSGNGKGIAVDNKTKKETFMKMIELQGLQRLRQLRLAIWRTSHRISHHWNQRWTDVGSGVGLGRGLDVSTDR